MTRGDRRGEHARVRRRPDAVIFGRGAQRRNDSSFLVGKICRTRDSTVIAERKWRDLRD
jgi:hypothetical protein